MSNTHAFVVKNGLEVGTSITATGQLTTAGQTFPASDGSTGQYLTTNGSGALSWGTVTTSFNITDGTTTDSVGGGETVTFTGGTNITLAVTDNTVTINNDVIDSGDITESGNLFFTDTRAVDAVEGHAHLTIDGGTLYVDTSNNYVGIGDTSPQQKLDVAGNIGINGTEVINASGTIVGAVADSAMTIGGSLAGVLSNTKMQYANSYSGTPIQGSFFFDSLNAKLKVYTGSAFVDAVPASSGGGGGSTDANSTFRDYSFTLTGTVSSITGVDDHELTAGAFVIGHKYTITSAGNTSFTGIGAADNNVNTVFVATGAGSGTGTAKQTLFYNTANNTSVAVYVNGVKQVYGSGRDFVATTGTSVNFTYNLGAGDTVDVQVFELLTNSAYYVKSEVYTKAETNTQVSTALPLAGGTMTGDTLHGDNVKAKFGTGNDLEIYHDGNKSYISDVGTGNLILTASNLTVKDAGGTNKYLTTDASTTATTIYHNNVARLATTSTGVSVTGSTAHTAGDITNSISGSYKLFGANGTAGNANYVTYAFEGDNNTGMFSGTADTVKFATGGSERMRIDSSGNVGIGVTSEAWNANYTALRLGTRTALFNTTAGNAETTVLSNNYVNSSSEQHIQTGPASFYQQYNGTHAFQVIPSAAAGAAVSITNAMTIKNNTNISIPSNTHAVVGVEEALNINCFRDGSGNDYGIFLNGNNSAGTHTSIRFHNNVHGVCGSITHGHNSTAYNTSSDYRLKTDVQPMTGATARLMQLKPCNFEWISSGERVDGFLAHELGGVIPAAATGTKDAMRDEEYEVTAATDTEAAVTGTRSVPDMQGIDQSKLVPLLTATIQELIARIEALENN